ncbi:MAG: lipopolysaccharide biosynthesis protein RfbH, partial [Eubacterium sp.]|nr:lipopolysaccharide biosynthesis protein RfbH [Eubacterium sp.]
MTNRWNSESEAREEIKSLVAQYYKEFKKPEQERPFSEGDRIAYASRVYDEKEMMSLTDATLD